MMQQVMWDPLSAFENLMIQKNGRTRVYSYENPNGEKGKAATVAGELGLSRKGAPFLRDVLPGKTYTLADVDGPGVIQHFFLTFSDLSSDERFGKMWLAIYWEQNSIPLVECSLENFFCCTEEKILENSCLLFPVIPAKSFHCFLPLPFQQHIRITLKNGYGKKISVVAYQITCCIGKNIQGSNMQFMQEIREAFSGRKIHEQFYEQHGNSNVSKKRTEPCNQSGKSERGKGTWRYERQ